MSRTTLFADVLLPLPIKGTFTYRIPYELNEFVKQGQRVAVQFGRKKVYAGLIKRLHEEVPEHTPKYILHLLDEDPLVNDIQFRFWEWIASYYMSTEGDVMNAALPSAFKLASESKVLLIPGFNPDEAILDEYEYRITESLLQKKRLTIGEISKEVGFAKVLPLLRTMIDKKMILMEEELEGGYKPKMEKYVGLETNYQDEENLQQLMEELGKRAFKQLEILMTFLTMVRFDEDEHLVKKTDLLKKANAGPSAFKAMVEKGVFTEVSKMVSRFDILSEKEALPAVELTEHQEEAYQKMSGEFEKHRVVLLHGVTSGGKTEIYIKLISEVIERGKQVLYLLPEIALTTQIINRLRKYFGEKVGVYHSRYNRNERAEVWNNIAGRDEAGDMREPYQIILGPRSASFLPFDNLGLVIVDEEHDQSYKQYDPAPRYNARDSAIYLSTMHDARVVLGSATPAVESYFNARIGKYGLAELTERYGGIKMPAVEVVDMRDQLRRRMSQSHFSSVLMGEMKKAISEKQQAILFQNRRGFSLRLECQQCSAVPECKNCDVTLTYHKHSELLKCHYCGYATPIPSSCGECGGTSLMMKGFGTEKVAEELSILMPDARIDRMDLDSTRKKHAFQRIISDFENKKTDILTGTQMVTKGLDFDNVQVVGVLSADNLLSFPDFRAHERSYQLMAQVSGRAGRKHKQGKVLIQSWQPAHPIITDVIRNDYLNMFEQQLIQRQRFRYPPFYRLIIIKLKHKDHQLLNEASASFGKQLRAIFGNDTYGPEFPMVSRIRLYYIKQIMIKQIRTAKMDEAKQKMLAALDDFRKLARYKSVRVHFDVDPQ